MSHFLNYYGIGEKELYETKHPVNLGGRSSMMARDRVNIFVSLFAVLYLVYLFFVFGCCVCGKCQHSQPGVYFFFSRSSVCELFLTVSRPRQYKGGKGAASPDSYSLRHIVEGVWGAEAQFQTFKFIKFFLVCQKKLIFSHTGRELCRHYVVTKIL